MHSSRVGTRTNASTGRQTKAKEPNAPKKKTTMAVTGMNIFLTAKHFPKTKLINERKPLTPKKKILNSLQRFSLCYDIVRTTNQKLKLSFSQPQID